MVRFNQWLGLACVAFATLASVPAQAAYFIRPFVQVAEGEIIDGYEADGATSGTQFFGTEYVSSVSLDEGKVRDYLRVEGSTGFGQVAGIFGDRLRFTGEAGSTINFNFDFDGTIFADAPVNDSLTLVVSANFFVFEAGSGATYLNFNSHPGAVVQKTLFDVMTLTEAMDEDYVRSLVGSMTLSGNGEYDVFAGLSIAVAKNGNPGLVEMDFSHTAAFGIQTAPGVSYTSDSGVFLSAAGAVPEPATWAMLLLGFGLAGGMMRRRSVAVAFA